ncbi:unnamed protein product [Kuraishia capsulata CBS 1993]|uniref:Zn(2)-C6 fungal-type domain-containing protein n=1 Tax=Kuraishia capsulata CBS 1993 TaxID=1382522 RepID=W6MVV7_9ASCO|nr:uncharacterized protein KUCA_T00002558001 [Kuraishia capsulata CBS 1993]CDK26585.1 unnamed protein product [Kuraishia capsulata CBS 1993]
MEKPESTEIFVSRIENLVFSGSEKPSRQWRSCHRCKLGRKKCDYSFPSCLSCLKVGAPCFGYHPVTKEALPRSVVMFLRETERKLQKRLEQVEQANNKDETGISASYIRKMVASVGRPLVDVTTPNSEQDITEYNLQYRKALILMFLLRPSSIPAPFCRRCDHPLSDPEPCAHPVDLASLPRDIFDHLLNQFVSVQLPQFPCVSEGEIKESRLRVLGQAESPAEPHDVVLISIVMAISANTLHWKDESNAIASSNALFATAVSHLTQIVWLPNCKTLTLLLLFAYYGYANPAFCDSAYVMQIAVRICLVLGLHKESTCHLDTVEQDTRRRLLLVTLSAERAFTSLLGVQMGFDTATVSALFPSVLGDQYITTKGFLKDGVATKVASITLWRLRCLETEIYDVLWLGSNPVTFDSIEMWREETMRLLDQWYEDSLEFHSKHQLNFRTAVTNFQKARLTRRSPKNPNPPPEMVMMCIGFIEGFTVHYFENIKNGTVSFNLFAAYFIAEGAACLCDFLWNRQEVVAQETRALQVAKLLESQLQVLTHISKRWPQLLECIKGIGELKLHILAAKYPQLLSNDVKPQTTLTEFEISEEVEIRVFPNADKSGGEYKGDPSNFNRYDFSGEDMDFLLSSGPIDSPDIWSIEHLIGAEFF